MKCVPHLQLRPRNCTVTTSGPSSAWTSVHVAVDDHREAAPAGRSFWPRPSSSPGTASRSAASPTDNALNYRRSNDFSRLWPTSMPSTCLSARTVRGRAGRPRGSTAPRRAAVGADPEAGYHRAGDVRAPDSSMGGEPEEGSRCQAARMRSARAAETAANAMRAPSPLALLSRASSTVRRLVRSLGRSSCAASLMTSDSNGTGGRPRSRRARFSNTASLLKRVRSCSTCATFDLTSPSNCWRRSSCRST